MRAVVDDVGRGMVWQRPGHLSDRTASLISETVLDALRLPTGNAVRAGQRRFGIVFIVPGIHQVEAGLGRVEPALALPRGEPFALGRQFGHQPLNQRVLCHRCCLRRWHDCRLLGLGRADVPACDATGSRNGADEPVIT